MNFRSLVKVKGILWFLLFPLSMFSKLVTSSSHHPTEMESSGSCGKETPFHSLWLLTQPRHSNLSLFPLHPSSTTWVGGSAFFTVQLSHPYMTTGKTIALTRRTFVGKVMSLLLNMHMGTSPCPTVCELAPKNSCWVNICYITEFQLQLPKEAGACSP